MSYGPTKYGCFRQVLLNVFYFRNPSVSSAALVSSYHLLATSTDFIKRWGGEIQEASSHDQQMIQYHATGLLYKIRKHDKLAVSKLVTKLSKSTRSPHACCLLIRIISRLLLLLLLLLLLFFLHFLKKIIIIINVLI